ncbi:hypothetical protein CEB3_c08510 [Peptococcaceae bacterium CEB3]|nr:hypothetical protein CEB3_c08510 [Peptococcaceae bacterium CEB3]
MGVHLKVEPLNRPDQSWVIWHGVRRSEKGLRLRSRLAFEYLSGGQRYLIKPRWSGETALEVAALPETVELGLS